MSGLMLFSPSRPFDRSRLRPRPATLMQFSLSRPLDRSRAWLDRLSLMLFFPSRPVDRSRAWFVRSSSTGQTLFKRQIRPRWPLCVSALSRSHGKGKTDKWPVLIARRAHNRPHFASRTGSTARASKWETTRDFYSTACA